MNWCTHTGDTTGTTSWLHNLWVYITDTQRKHYHSWINILYNICHSPDFPSKISNSQSYFYWETRTEKSKPRRIVSLCQVPATGRQPFYDLRVLTAIVSYSVFKGLKVWFSKLYVCIFWPLRIYFTSLFCETFGCEVDNMVNCSITCRNIFVFGVRGNHSKRIFNIQLDACTGPISTN